MTVRLNKYLAQAGVASRRGADALIEEGRVVVNGRVAQVGDRVVPEDTIAVDGAVVGGARDLVILALYKPRGVVSTLSDPHAERTIADLIPERYGRLNPVGRLDKETEGLMVLTNDGELHQRLTHPSFEHEKEYMVTVRRTISDSELEQLASGIDLEEGSTGTVTVRRLDDDRFSIVLRQGWNRQIRRMCEAVGHRVAELVRTRVVRLSLGAGPLSELHPGKVVEITEGDILG